MINVKVGKLPGRLVDVALGPDATVGDALEAASLDSSGYEIRVGTLTKSISDPVSNGDTVLLVKMIKGN